MPHRNSNPIKNPITIVHGTTSPGMFQFPFSAFLLILRDLLPAYIGTRAQKYCRVHKATGKFRRERNRNIGIEGRLIFIPPCTYLVACSIRSSPLLWCEITIKTLWIKTNLNSRQECCTSIYIRSEKVGFKPETRAGMNKPAAGGWGVAVETEPAAVPAHFWEAPPYSPIHVPCFYSRDKSKLFQKGGGRKQAKQQGQRETH